MQNIRLFFGVFFVALVICPFSAIAQSCLPEANMQQNSSDITPAGSDGLVHTTYTFVDSTGNVMTPDANTLAAFNSAISQWNGVKATTGVQFDPLPTGQPGNSADIQVQLTTDASGSTGGCAAYQTDTNRIYYGETFMQAAQSTSIGATILMHELGHSLGLDDGGTNPSPPSIMNNPSNAPPSGCIAPNVVTSTIQPNDSAAVAACITSAHYYRKQLLSKLGLHASVDFSDPTTIQQTSPVVCTYTYATDYVLYSDGSIDSEDPFLVSVSCSS